jgi:sugar phosphate isomerase/epimerase
MKYGLNLLLWTDRMHDGLVPTVERIKALGYDGVEMPIFELNEPLYRSWGGRLDGLGLERSGRPATTRSAPRPRSGRRPSMPSAARSTAATPPA